MTRPPDLDKKPALLERIVDSLLDKPLSALTFRSLAAALEVSTFALVYHFGTRAELIRDIIATVATRKRGFEAVFVASDLTLDSYLAGLRATFELTLLPRNRALQRLEFEAQMLEALEVDHGVTRTVHEELQQQARDTLASLGVSREDAAIESRLLIDTFYGIQVGLVVNRDDVRATDAFNRALAQHRHRLVELGAAHTDIAEDPLPAQP